MQAYFFGNNWKESIIYANPAKDTKGTNLWATNLVFNHENGKWYEYIVKHPSNNSRESYSMTSLNKKTWTDFKGELEDIEKWKVVD